MTIASRAGIACGEFVNVRIIGYGRQDAIPFSLFVNISRFNSWKIGSVDRNLGHGIALHSTMNRNRARINLKGWNRESLKILPVIDSRPLHYLLTYFKTFLPQLILS